MSLYIGNGGILYKPSALSSFTFNSSVTFSCWIKVDSLSVGYARPVMQLTNTSGSDRAALMINTSNQIAAYSKTFNGDASSTTSGTIQAGKWHHVAAVIGGGSFRQAYLDGIAATASTTIINVSITATQLQCGGYYIPSSSSLMQDPLLGFIAHPAMYYSFDVITAGRLSIGDIQRLSKMPPDHARKKDLYWAPDLSQNIAAEDGRVTIKTKSFRSASAQFAERNLLDFNVILSGRSSKDEPPIQDPRSSFASARFAFPDITNKLRAQAAFLKPYTGILPIADG